MTIAQHKIESSHRRCVISFFRVLFAFVCLFLCCSPSQTQQTSSTTSTPQATQRDATSIAILNRAIVVMGGANAFGQIQSALAQGTLNPAPGETTSVGNVAFEDQFTAAGHEFRDQFQSTTLNQTFVSGHGSPGLTSGARATKFIPYMATFRLPTHLPQLVLGQILANSSCNLEYVGPVMLNGQSAVQVHVHADTDILQQTLSVQDWYFDPASGLPIHLEYRLPDASNALYFVPAAVDFLNYRFVQGFLFPFQLLCYEDGTLRHTLTLSTVTINPPVSASDFDLSTAVSQ